MGKENYTELKTANLRKTKKSLTTLTGLLAGALIVLFVMAVLSFIKKGFTALVIIPLALLPILILNFSQITAINKELKNRNTDQ